MGVTVRSLRKAPFRQNRGCSRGQILLDHFRFKVTGHLIKWGRVPRTRSSTPWWFSFQRFIESKLVNVCFRLLQNRRGCFMLGYIFRRRGPRTCLLKNPLKRFRFREDRFIGPLLKVRRVAVIRFVVVLLLPVLVIMASLSVRRRIFVIMVPRVRTHFLF